MTKAVGACLAAAVLASAGPWSVHAADTADTTANATMGSLRWLTGVWESKPRDGAQSEYVYMPLFNGILLSTDISAKDGAPTRYELRVIKTENGQVLFRELGFNPNLSAAAPVPNRPLLSADSKQLNFTDMRVTRTGPNTATLELTLHPSGGTQTRTVTMQLHRVYRFEKVG